jgi:hypothetical protein
VDRCEAIASRQPVKLATSKSGAGHGLLRFQSAIAPGEEEPTFQARATLWESRHELSGAKWCRRQWTDVRHF